MCRQCPVQADCLEFALTTNQDSGHLGRHVGGGAARAAPRVRRPPEGRRRLRAPSAQSWRRVPQEGAFCQLCARSALRARGASARGRRPSCRCPGPAAPGTPAGGRPARRPGWRSRRASSVVTSVRTIVEPEAGRLVDREVVRHADPVVDHLHGQVVVVVLQEHHDVARAVAVDEGVRDGVLQQLGEHDGQRGGHAGRQLAAVALDPEAHRPLRRLQRVLGQAQQGPDDLDEGHVVAGLPGQRLVHDGDGADAADRLGQHLLGLVRRRCAGPGGAGATRSSAGCSSPGGGSRGWWRPWTAAAGPAGAARSRPAAAGRHR